jgi:Zn-dependent protease
MNAGVPIGRLFGTEVRAHWTWVFLLALTTVVFGSGLSARTDIGFDAVSGWTTAVVCAVLLFASVAVHELAHVYMARRNGVGGSVVVVQVLGGTYLMEVHAKTPSQELRVAIAGPLASLAMFAVFGGFGIALDILWGGPPPAPIVITCATVVGELIGVFNLFLAAINMVPGYPMDGARVVHALAWSRTGLETSGNAAASRVGRWTGLAAIAIGAVIAPMTDWWPGLALVVAGWMLVGSSRLLDRRALLQGLLAGALVSDAADVDLARIPPQLTLDVFAGQYLAEGLGTVALVERGQELLGLIGTSQIRRIPRRNWASMHTEQAMVPLAKVPWIAADLELWPALELLERSGLDALLIGTGLPVSAMLTRRSATRLIRERVEEQARQLAAAKSLVAAQVWRGFRGRPGPGAGPGSEAASGPGTTAGSDSSEPAPPSAGEPPSDDDRDDQPPAELR